MILVLGGEYGGVWGINDIYGAGKTPDGYSVRSFISFDITDLVNLKIEYSELEFNFSEISEDPFLYGPICIAVVDWGGKAACIG